MAGNASDHLPKGSLYYIRSTRLAENFLFFTFLLRLVEVANFLSLKQAH